MVRTDTQAARRVGALLRAGLAVMLTLGVASMAPRAARGEGAIQYLAGNTTTGACPGNVAARFGIQTTSGKPAPWALASMPNVAAFSASDIWLAGSATRVPPLQGATPLSTTLSVIEHWDGSRWCVAANTEFPGFMFQALAAVTPSDIWAARISIWLGRSVLEHWDGRSWSVVSPPAGPSVPGSAPPLVAASSSHNVWVIGAPTRSTIAVTHWDGQRWQVSNVGLPRLSRNVVPAWTALTTRSDNDTWASTLSPYYLLSPPAVLHWDGSRWYQAVLPPQADTRRQVTIDALAPIASNNVWAIGDYQLGSGRLSGGPVAFHWDGRAWSQVSVPNNPQAADPVSDAPGWSLHAIAVFSPTDILAFGGGGPAHPVHWNGHAWTIMTMPVTGPIRNPRIIGSISVVRPADIWAAEYPPALDHWDGHRWSAVPIVPAG